MKRLPDVERRELQLRYAAWIRSGARAGRTWLAAGILLLALAALVAVNFWPGRTVLAACAIGAAAGVVVFRIGARAERAWREQNPFEY